jgi:hypothetical protein
MSLLFSFVVPAPANHGRSVSSSLMGRSAAYPPASRRRHQEPGLGAGLWLQTLLGRRPSAAERRLHAAREAFASSLGDLRGQRAVEMRARLRNAPSLRELWHLRPAVFDLLSLNLGQTEAERRLAELNVYFPTRSPRSGLGPLDTGR